MALLTDAERELVLTQWETQNDGVNAKQNAITRDQCRAAINDIDQYQQDTAAAANNAIPEPARGSWTKSMKAQASTLVTAKRYITDA